MNRAVFFDRDGTLVRAFPEGDTTRGPRIITEVELLPGVGEAIQKLKERQWLTIVVSNQPDISRGLTNWNEQLHINHWLIQTHGLSAAYLCPHDHHDRCACRKPQPGLLYAAAIALNIALADSYMVGDRLSDHKAGGDAGCYPLLIHTNQGIKEAVEWILDRSK